MRSYLVSLAVVFQKAQGLGTAVRHSVIELFVELLDFSLSLLDLVVGFVLRFLQLLDPLLELHLLVINLQFLGLGLTLVLVEKLKLFIQLSNTFALLLLLLLEDCNFSLSLLDLTLQIFLVFLKLRDFLIQELVPLSLKKKPQSEPTHASRWAKHFDTSLIMTWLGKSLFLCIDCKVSRSRSTS